MPAHVRAVAERRAELVAVLDEAPDAVRGEEVEEDEEVEQVESPLERPREQDGPRGRRAAAAAAETAPAHLGELGAPLRRGGREDQLAATTYQRGRRGRRAKRATSERGVLRARGDGCRAQTVARGELTSERAADGCVRIKIFT